MILHNRYFCTASRFDRTSINLTPLDPLSLLPLLLHFPSFPPLLPLLPLLHLPLLPFLLPLPLHPLPLLRRHKPHLPLPPPLLRPPPLPLLPLLPLPPLLRLPPQKVLARLNLQVDLTLLPRRRERRIHLPALIHHLERLPPLRQRPLLEMRQEAIPVLGREGRVGAEFALDHQLLDVVDGVDVRHAVRDHAADFFEPRVGPHDRDGVALHHDVGARQQLQRLERRAVRAEDALAPFDEALFVADQVADLDDVGGDAVVEDLDGLRGGHAAREELDEVARFEDRGWVVGLARGAHGHAAFDEVERAGDVLGGEGAGDEGPGGAQVGLTVFGEEGCEGGFVGEGAGGVVGGVEWIDLGRRVG